MQLAESFVLDFMLPGSLDKFKQMLSP